MAWTPENISALIIAVTGLITAVGAILHSRNTRSMVKGKDTPPGK